MLKELIEEKVHMLTGYNSCKEAENPFTSIHVGTDVVFDEMELKFGNVTLY